MATYLACLSPPVSQDFAVLSENLGNLVRLNTVHNLFTKTAFTQEMRFTFLEKLFKLRIERTHESIQDNINDAIYNLAKPDLASFHQTFIPLFLQSAGLPPSSQDGALLASQFSTAEDMPTFTTSVDRLCRDIAFFLSRAAVA
eukprot:TRINITY_DN25441_c0_g1_i1.p1 TRINITY_DN25441_c0_g1~~TRINITY_DN25441_c0_g1_i1.p1  ORF type:complete len:157 (-),score=26.59 TRINITY_DN25441_c0_g1_i1:113-541(-)